MMKHVAFLSATVALLVFSGCSSKEPSINATANQGATQGSSMNASGTGMDANAVISPVTNASANDSTTGATDGSDSKIVSILFDYDKYNIRSDMEKLIKNDASLVKNKTVKLEGNCDEFGSDEYNYALGLKRANTVKASLVNEGINADSITMVSLGEGNPVCLEKTKECWAKNRRVDFKLP